MNGFLNMGFKEDVEEIVKNLSDVEIESDVIEMIYQKANRFRQIVKLLNKIEQIAKTNDCKIITKADLGW